jgi:hypothetical protein
MASLGLGDVEQPTEAVKFAVVDQIVAEHTGANCTAVNTHQKLRPSLARPLFGWVHSRWTA